VDYVILFRFPVQPSKKSNMSREDLESLATVSMTKLTQRLTKVGLRFQVRPGKENGLLYILVSSPLNPVLRIYEQERDRDFLLGVRVNDLGNSSGPNALKDITEAEWSRLVYELLTLPEEDGGAGISSLIDEHVDSIFPLHDDKFNEEWIQSCSRKVLLSEDDISKVRDHFGEKIAYYFLFLQNYFIWLGIPAILGILVYFTHLNTLSVWFSFSMLVWSILFIEIWERKEKEYAVKWGVRNYAKHEKKRADFKGDKMVIDQVTGESVPFVSPWKLLGRRLATIPGVLVGALFLTVIVSFVFCLQLFLHEYYNGPLRQILVYLPTVGYVLFIPTMTGFYTRWVKALNDWEMYKTSAQWEYHYTEKIFIANFLVGYLSLFIIGWVYIPFGDHILPFLVQLNISHEHKAVDFERLRSQLKALIVTGQLIGFLTEMIVPYVLRLLSPYIKIFIAKITRRKPETNTDFVKQTETENTEEIRFMNKVMKEASLPEYNIYLDYVEMVIQYGYVSMFSTVWPLTALCCMINDWVELRGDAIKVCKYTRKPVPHKADSIGPWISNLKTLVWLSSITMSSYAYMFHPSTNIHSSYTPMFTILAILVSEHIYIVLDKGLKRIVAMIPSWSENVVKKEEYELKKAWLNTISISQGCVKRNLKNDELDLRNESTAKLWSSHLNPTSESSNA
ncbi:DUF590-domain-containing protein, partial [Backusella circina FSU 941]